ncbi:sigma-70 family RNA polymerase sigma factor [Cetobacterium somerae]|uniref:sigma-70 family RNA polymerase sigma factor n=1 Tax=Cetobacterium sp. NK01 TaxID=2993530 RepID=UPI002116EE00|nr:sigma-70 family RNA polymerase sigma factor [Cetobacterium sp. NK01]MCQ8213568.1 sigma-70 family RNA polymerase sigma factor [Cetobacterium sp. NK01]
MIEKKDLILAQQGDEYSLEKIIKEFHGTVYKNSHSFFLKGGDNNDLIQEGFIGLIKAIQSYDENRNACFNTFANLCIKRQMITAVKNHNSDKYKNLNSAMQGKSFHEQQEQIYYHSPSLSLYSPEDVLLGKELVKLLENFLLENLSELEKKVFYYLCKQQTYIEISKLLNETPKKIDNTIQRVKKKIHNYLESYLEDSF